MEDKLTTNEKGILEIIRYNQSTPIKVRIDKRFKIGKFDIHIEWRTSANLWGRFGGGWNWKLGIMWSSYTVILNLLVMSIRINHNKEATCPENSK